MSNNVIKYLLKKWKKNCTKLVTLVTYHNLDLGRVEKSFLSLDFRMGTSSTST